jgi:hypothetical protein
VNISIKFSILENLLHKAGSLHIVLKEGNYNGKVKKVKQRYDKDESLWMKSTN